VIRSVSIRGYRGFADFAMSSLGSVNLLVGKNNSGKTSVLEALYLLASAGDPGALWRIVARRGERVDLETSRQSTRETELDISHLFYGHELKPGAKIIVAALNAGPDRSLTLELSEQLPRGERAEVLESPSDEDDIESERDGIAPRLALVFGGKPKPPIKAVRLTRHGGLFTDALDRSAGGSRGGRTVRALRPTLCPQNRCRWAN
jgi:predicted ATP-dependent endonuclease of OLD family